MRDQEIARGAADKQRADMSGPHRGWECNSALENVAGLPAFGLVTNKPGGEDAMLQFYVGGTAPGLGVKHYAFASDCFPRAPSNGSFAV